MNPGLATWILPIPLACLMFTLAPIVACGRSLPRRAVRLRPGTLPDHGVQRVGEQPARAPVEAAHVAEASRLLKITLDESHVALVVELVPDGDRFHGGASVSLFLHTTTVQSDVPALTLR